MYLTSSFLWPTRPVHRRTSTVKWGIAYPDASFTAELAWPFKPVIMKTNLTIAAVSITFAVMSIVTLGAQPESEAVPTPFVAEPFGTGPVKVGPEHGTVIAVGGGSLGQPLYDAFIEAAGG